MPHHNFACVVLNSCWISGYYGQANRIWWFVGPALFVMVINICILYLALKAAFSAKSRKNPNAPPTPSNGLSASSAPRATSGGSNPSTSISQSTASSSAPPPTQPSVLARLAGKLSWLKGSASLVVILGLTWLFGLLYINEYSLYFSYIFILLNGLQVR